jgi:hypothetical protein
MNDSLQGWRVRTTRALAALLVVRLFAACGESEGDDGSSSRGGSAGSEASSGTAGSGGTHAGSSGAAAGGRAGMESGGSSGAAGSASGGTGAGGSGGEGGSSAPDALDDLVDTFCRAARSCCERAGMPAGAGCEDEVRGTIETFRLVEGGTVEVNQAALSDCIEAYREATTGCTLTDVLANCHGIFVGTVPDGGPCTSVLECDRASGPKVCLLIQGDADPTVGTCLTPPRGTSGTLCAQSCQEGRECSTTASAPDAEIPLALCYEEDGLYCPIGESCAPIVDDGAECQWHEACGSNGYCLSTCASRSATGESCQFNYGCVAGTSCVAGECAPEPFASSETCAGHPPSLD